MVDLKRTNNPEILRQVAFLQDAEIRRLHLKLQEVTREYAAFRGLSKEELEAQLKLLQKEIASVALSSENRGSERRPHDKDEEPKEKKPQKGHGPTEQSALPVVDVIHPLDEADQVCTECGGKLEVWEGQFEESEEIDVIEIQYILKKHLRKKYRCGCGGKIETAPGPVKLISGGRYSLDFAIHVATQKYLEHMPLERLVKHMKRHGLIVTTQTLWDQIWPLCLKLEGTATRIHEHVLQQDVAVGDETHWKRLNEKKNGFTWTLVTEKATSYKVLETRSNASADKMLEGFEGVLVADGYVIYPSQSKKRGFVLAHDWCHLRRRFIEAELTSPKEAQEFLDDIGKLFGIERELASKTQNLSTDSKSLILEIRQQRSKPIVNAIGKRAAELRVIPGTPIAKAMGYLDRHWSGLTVFLNDPRVPITSNAAERALRPPVLGRNNYLGSRSDRGMKAAGIFYTIIATCLQNNVDPAKYMRNVVLAELRNETFPLPHEL